MKLACVLLNYKTAEMTKKALDCLVPAVDIIEHHTHIYVVDNDSRDGSEMAIRAHVDERGYEDVEVVQTGHNGGFGAGNNHAIRRALALEEPPEYVYLLNSDAFVAEDAVKLLVEHLDAHPQAGVAGSYIHGPEGDPHVTSFRFPSPLGELEGHLRLGLVTTLLQPWVVPLGIPGFTCEVDWLAGASMLLRRTMLEEIGLFDETFFLYYEETDLCYRAKSAGWQVWYVPTSQVAHIGSATTGMKDFSTPMPGFMFDSRRHFFLKTYGRGGLWAANLAHLAGAGMWRMRRALEKKPRQDRPRSLRNFVRHSLTGRVR